MTGSGLVGKQPGRPRMLWSACLCGVAVSAAACGTTVSSSSPTTAGPAGAVRAPTTTGRSSSGPLGPSGTVAPGARSPRSALTTVPVSPATTNGLAGGASATTAPFPVPSAPPTTASPSPSTAGSVPAGSATGTLTWPVSGIQADLAGREGQTTVAVWNQQSQQEWTVNPDIAEDTASIVKLQIMGAKLLDAQHAGTALSSSDASLMTTMIENSDNDSATTLWNEVGGPTGVASFDQEVGLDDTQPSSVTIIPGTDLPGWGLTTTTASDQVTMVKALAYPNAVLSPMSQHYGLSLMENIESDQDWGVTGGVPAGVTVALKNGWLPLSAGWQVNSVGWVDGDGRNYVLAVLTDGAPSEQYGIDTIQAISTTVFNDLG
jgi:Beta-lactamase enzyme family